MAIITGRTRFILFEYQCSGQAGAVSVGGPVIDISRIFCHINDRPPLSKVPGIVQSYSR